MNKFKINKGREKLSDQEIEKQMNFDKFMSGYTPVKGWFPKGAQLNLLVVSAAVVLVVAGYLVYSSKTKDIASEKPFINPPVKAMDLPSAAFMFDNVKDTTFVYNTGTLIHVPAGAFADKEGNNVTGAVELRYREFHDPIDIMLSGIPMNYDSAGTHYQLESAGMFEVLAYQNDEPVYLKPGKNLSVDLVSHTDNATDYNIYYLDTVKRQWNYIAENTKKNNNCFPIFENNPDYKEKAGSLKAKANSLNANSGSKDLTTVLNKPVLPKKEDPRAYNFVIDFKKNEFPELAAYSGLKFQPAEGKKKQHADLAQKAWEDVLIERLDDEHYTITFSSEIESHTIKVIPVVDEKNYAATMNDYKQRQKQYAALLLEKKKNANEKKDSLYRLKEMYAGYALTSNLNERFKNFIDGSYMETSKDMLLYRTFRISNLGIWNSDKPYPSFASVAGEHTAQFLSMNNQPLILKTVFLVRRNVNSLYSIQEQGFNHFPTISTIDLMVGLSYSNELFYIKDEDLKHTDQTRTVVRFEMNKQEGALSVPQLKDLLKI